MSRSPFSLLLAPALAAALAGTASADFITGRVVDQNGVGVAGVDIDAKNLGSGGDPTLFNDGTDANGFFTTTIPAGTYRITFNPPPPPASACLILEVDDFVVSGTTDMGTRTLPAGVALYGTVRNPAAQPVAGINLDVIELATGNNVNLIHDTTDALGQIAMAVPAGAIELRLDTTPVVGQTLAPTALTLTLGGDTNIGTVSLQQGFVLSALLRGPGSVPVVDADLDVVDSATGATRYTPGDNSNTSGFVDVVVPAGTFAVQICPKPGDLFVARELTGVVVTGNTSLGIQTLLQGFLLSGTVRNGSAQPIGGVDVDVEHSATGVPVFLCRDDSAGNGTFGVVVPSGTFDVSFSPPYAQPLGERKLTGVLVAGATSVNPVLPPCPYQDGVRGSGTAGTGGLVPQIASGGTTPRLGNPGYAISISNARGGAGGLLIVGIAGDPPTPFPSGLQPAKPFALLGGPVPLALSGPVGQAGAGAQTLFVPIPPTAALAGRRLAARAYVDDRFGVGGLALSPILVATVCP